MSILRYILIYSFVLALVGIILLMNEYWFWYKIKSFNVYGAFVALIFLAIGLYFGRNRKSLENKSTPHDQVSHSKFETNKFNLSNREQEVFLLMAQGLSNQEISIRLFISESTVKTHLSRIFDKLGVKNRTSALNKVREAGILNEKL